MGFDTFSAFFFPTPSLISWGGRVLDDHPNGTSLDDLGGDLSALLRGDAPALERPEVPNTPPPVSSFGGVGSKGTEPGGSVASGMGGQEGGGAHPFHGCREGLDRVVVGYHHLIP